MPPLSNGAPHQLVAYGEDPVAVLANTIVSEQVDTLPDLTHVTVLTNNPNRISELRRQLLRAATKAGAAGILGPRICSLREFVAEQNSASKPLIADRARELMLFKALQQHRGVFGEISTWFLVDNLLNLFDELTATQFDFPMDENGFVSRLASAYGLENTHNSALGREAKIIHTLWHAYHEELDATGFSDKETAYQRGLTQLQNKPNQQLFYIAGYYRFLPAELNWLNSLEHNNQLRLVLHGQSQPDAANDNKNLQSVIRMFSPEAVKAKENSYCQFLNNVYSSNNPDTAGFLKQRAQQFARQHPVSPAKKRLCLSCNPSPEHEAEAVALQLAKWRSEGKKQLAIVTEDRRLARRVRALLERYGLTVNDYTGWALSTTSAAAAVNCWLDCIEQDFAYQPLLDLLKSPYILPDWERQTLSKATYRFEQDIVCHENVQANLSRYRFHIRSRQRRLQWQDTIVTDLLDALEHASLPVTEMLQNGQKISIIELLCATELSLQRIGLINTLQNDEAGQAIIEQLLSLHAASDSVAENMTWHEFRRWFARALEHSYFQLGRSEEGIALLPLTQSNLERFDGIVIAAADNRHLPLIASPSPLFNQAVRKELGLRTYSDELDAALYHFRRLLESAPEVVATYSRDNNGEPQALSSWLQLLNAFHELAYADDLHDHHLANAVSQRHNANQTGDSAVEKLRRPAPRVPPELIPDSYSAYSYQEIIHCPYRFYAHQCLELAAPETIREALQKSDYGELVHRCLQALHSEVKGLPGPLSAPLTTASRQEGIELLNRIAAKVFAEALADSSLHRLWLQRWQRCIPQYIDWQIEQGRHSQVRENECFITIAANEQQPGLRGRIDRVDSSDEGDIIIDYKTGYSANLNDVVSGESVQLPFYAMLWQKPVTQCKYVELGESIKETRIEHAALGSLSQQNQQRLNTLHQQLRQGHAMTAWGDETVCQYCDFQGVCRKQSWSE